jgi:hypothetical protein
MTGSYAKFRGILLSKRWSKNDEVGEWIEKMSKDDGLKKLRPLIPKYWKGRTAKITERAHLI